MVEWYEAYADYSDGMRRTEEFTAASVRGALGTTVITRDGREIDMAPPWPRKPLAEAIREACGVDVLALRDPGRAARRAGRARRGRGRGRRHLAAARRPRALALRRARHRRARLPGRLPDRALAAGAPVRRRSVAGRALRGVLLRHGVRERLQRAERPRRCSSSASRSRPRCAPPGTRTPSRSTRTTSRRCATACRPPRASASASTASRCSSATARRSATWCSSRRCATRELEPATARTRQPGARVRTRRARNEGPDEPAQDVRTCATPQSGHRYGLNATGSDPSGEPTESALRTRGV